jgi:uncharacterized protein
LLSINKNGAKNMKNQIQKYLRCFSLFLFVFVLHATLLGESRTPDAEVAIPMRDGKLLPTNFFFPATLKETIQTQKSIEVKYPCVLVRQPLGKDYLDPRLLELIDAGYILAVQSTRSSCDPTGTSLPYMSDAWGSLQDGYDTVEWLGKKCSWTNGKIATVGQSATGITQLLLAPTAPENLVCQYIEVATPSLYHYAIWPGQFRKEQVESWLKSHKSASIALEQLHSQPHYNAFWKQVNAIEKAHLVKCPQVHVGGWYDIFLQGTIDAFSAVQTNSCAGCKEQHKLIIGPWAHRWKGVQELGDFPVPSLGNSPLSPVSAIAWFDHYMKGENNGIGDAPSIQYYVMGPFEGTPSKGNKWKSARRWPPDATYVQMYLTDKKTLQKGEKPTSASLCHVLFDPLNPVPTIGGRNLFIPSGPKNLQGIEERSDVITFTTETLTEDTEVTGHISALLYASNVCCERDVCLRLTDVYPDGKSILIAEGTAHISPQEPKTAQPVHIDMWSTSMVFAKGHKIRLTVSGSNFPAYEASLASNPENIEQDKQNVCFSLHSGGSSASYISLPIVENPT